MNDNNIIFDQRYNSLGFELRKQHKIEFQEFLEENLKNHFIEKQIIVNKSPNRLGKIISTIELLYEMGYRVFFATDRHNHIREIKRIFKKKDIRITQWRGFNKACLKLSETEFLYENKVPARILCAGCEYKEDGDCVYHNQFQSKDKIIAGPKEFLKSKHLEDLEPDVIVWDEVLYSKDKIEPFIPEGLTEDDFEDYDVNYFYIVYEQFLEFKNVKKVENHEKLGLDKDLVDSQVFIDLLVKKIHENRELKYDIKFMDIFQFITKLGNTIKWALLCARHGYREVFYELYLIYALKSDSHLIILNTTFDDEIYNSIIQNRNLKVPELKPFEFTIPKNNESHFIFYKVNRRSCSKGSLFETDDNGKMLKDDSGVPIIKEHYGEDVFNLIFWAIDFCLSKGLKVE